MYQCEACYSQKVNSSCLSLLLKQDLYIPNLSPFCLSNAYLNFCSQFTLHSSNKPSLPGLQPPLPSCTSCLCFLIYCHVSYQWFPNIGRIKGIAWSFLQSTDENLVSKEENTVKYIWPGFIHVSPSVEVFIWDLNTVHQLRISCGVYASTDLVIPLKWAVRTCEWVPNFYSFQSTLCQACCRSVVFKLLAHTNTWATFRQLNQNLYSGLQCSLGDSSVWSGLSDYSVIIY